MLKVFKKAIAVCLVGFGLRNIISYITSDNRLVISNWNSSGGSWNIMAYWLKTKECFIMKIVVKKVPKFLRGFVKLFFGIKE